MNMCQTWSIFHKMTSSNGNIFRVTGPFGGDRWPVNSPHKGQWYIALMFSLICAWTNGWVNNWYIGDLRRHHTHYDVSVMSPYVCVTYYTTSARIFFLKSYGYYILTQYISHIFSSLLSSSYRDPGNINQNIISTTWVDSPKIKTLLLLIIIITTSLPSHHHYHHCT